MENSLLRVIVKIQNALSMLILYHNSIAKFVETCRGSKKIEKSLKKLWWLSVMWQIRERLNVKGEVFG